MVTRTFTLGRYTCVERLGTDPVGELWRAKRFGLVGVETQLLITRLHPALSKDPAGLLRLQTALKTYAELQTADSQGGVLRLVEPAVQQSGNDAFAVFEFVGFGDLRKLRPGFDLLIEPARAAAVWPAVVAHIGHSLANTLAMAHERGLWHGFLSPTSVWLDSTGPSGMQGRVLLSDLGLAQILSPAAWSSDPNLKPLQSYLPKEVQTGTPPGPFCDIYALGVLLSELLDSGGKAAANKALMDGLRPLLDRARSGVRTERPNSMRELAAAFEALSGHETATVREVLARIAEKFQGSSDTVPQPVTVSERSSAEPLPPPPAAKAGDVKVSVAGVSARHRVSAVGDKPLKSVPPREPSDSAKKPARAAAQPDAEAIPGLRDNDETPLPTSRPLLATNPKIATSTEESGRRQLGKATTGSVEAVARTDDSKQNRGRSKDDLKPGVKPRSGLEWLASKSDQVSVDEAGEKPATGKLPQQRVSGANSAIEARPSTSPSPPAPTVSAAQGATPAAGTAAKTKTSPVTVNPRARTPGQRANAAQTSAATPTAEVDVAEVSAVLEMESQGQGKAASSKDLRGAAAAMANSVDLLSVGETNPQLVPVKLFAEKGAIDDEPTNQASLDAAARAVATADPAIQGKRRSGPISEPNARVLTNTAPADVIKIPTDAVELDPTAASGSSSGHAAAVAAATKSVEVPPENLKPKRSRPLLLIGGGLTLLLACGLGYLLLATPTASTSAGKNDGGLTENKAADAGTAKEREQIPADSLPLNTTPNAVVLIDGEEKGSTPLTLKLSAGKHKLVLIAEDYALLRREVSAGAKLELALEPAKLPAEVSGAAALKIKCKTDGKRRILVDGNDSGHSCPSDAISVSPGKHVLGFLDPASGDVKEKKIKAKKGKKPLKLKVKY